MSGLQAAGAGYREVLLALIAEKAALQSYLAMDRVPEENHPTWDNEVQRLQRRINALST